MSGQRTNSHQFKENCLYSEMCEMKMHSRKRTHSKYDLNEDCLDGNCKVRFLM